MPGLCIGLAKTPGAIRAPAPRLGEHDANGRPLGTQLPRVATMPSPACDGDEWRSTAGTWARSAGVRVLDLGTILAGPYAGTLLAGLGADVVKVEAPAGDAFRETGFVYNRGMRGLAIDLSQPGRPGRRSIGWSRRPTR